MYKLLIVDDEEIIRRSIARILDWESLGFSSVRQAEDGRQALEMSLSDPPDLVLADIRMPFMDGLELAEALREKLPATCVVILSGHNEFALAQQAIGAGVLDYILKPLGAASLTAKMKEIKEKLDARRKDFQYLEKMRAQLRQSLPPLRESFWEKLTCLPGRKDPADTERRMRLLEMPLTEGPYTVCVIEPDLSHTEAEDTALFAYAIRNIVTESLGDAHPVFMDPKGRIVALFHLPSLPVSPEGGDMIPSVLKVIQNSIDLFLGISATFATGTRADAVDGLHSSYTEAPAALECKYTLGEGRIYSIYDLDYLESEFIYPFDAAASLLMHVKTWQQEPLAMDLEAIAALLRERKASPDNIKLVFVQLVTELMKLLVETQTTAPETWTAGLSLFQYIERSRTIEDLVSALRGFAVTVAKRTAEARTNSTRMLVGKARAYIESHYMQEQLSLEAVSAHVCVSSGYLSALFKKETGINFTDCLTRVRMEKAVDLLRTTDLKGYEVADRIGFSNPHYFSIAFKKHTGRSPSEFKEDAKDDSKGIAKNPPSTATGASGRGTLPERGDGE